MNADAREIIVCLQLLTFLLYIMCTKVVQSRSDRFVKKTLGGSPTGKRVEAPQALTCNTNTGVRIDPPRSSNRRRLGGSKKSLGGLNPPNTPGKSDPAVTLMYNIIICIHGVVGYLITSYLVAYTKSCYVNLNAEGAAIILKKS